MKTLALSVLFALLVMPAVAQDPGGDQLAGKCGPLLARTLVDPTTPWLQAGGTFAVWIYLADRDLDPDQLERALADAEAGLPERTLRRREKMIAPDARAVDARDLPLAAGYLDALRATGARLRQRSRWLNAASVDATPAQLNALARLPFVTRLELVAKFRRPTPPVTDDERAASEAARDAAAAGDGRWNLDYGGSLAGLEQINVPPVHELGITGEGVLIGMLDSGFKTTHVALSAVSVVARHDFVNDDDVVENEPGDLPYQHNHGTQTLSTIMGFRSGALVGPAYGASVILAKTEDLTQEMPIEEDRWVAGLEWVESLGADLVSSSLGYHDWYEFADLDGNTAVTTVAADLAVGRGLVVVNSAGNERGIFNFDHIIAPADGDSVIAVGAVDLDGEVASFSSPGPTFDGRIKPDVAAQGVETHVVSPDNDQEYTTADGTSFACPLASGVAALVLARAPALTPIQVREAMRQTADRADAPNNDYGWGVLDAFAAVTYWGPVFDHTPLGDFEDTVGPYVVAAAVQDRLPLDPSRMAVFWRADGGPWQQTALVSAGGDLWQAQIPGQPAGTEVAYYLEATDQLDITSWLPATGAAAPLTFAVGPDTTAPVLGHQPLGDQPLQLWPPVVIATAGDNLGVDRVELFFAVNGGPPQGPYLLDGGEGIYSGAIPLAAGDLAVGDQVSYTLVAWDTAGIPNSAQSGPHGFEIIGTLGSVVVVDDAGSGQVDQKIAADETVLAPRAGRSAASDIALWLGEAGYAVDVIAAAAVGPGSFAGYQAVVYSAGDSTTPLAGSALRDALRTWVLAGGRLLIEGGEVGYDVLQNPGYDEIAQDVLHVVSWRIDNGGALQVATGRANHPLLVRPPGLPSTIVVDYGGYGDQDAVNPASDAWLIMTTSLYPGSAGIVVYDDTPAPQAGQTVYLAFNIGAVEPTVGRLLCENALAYLLAAETPPTSAITGRVTLVGGGDPAGAVVAVGPDNQAVAAADGQYRIDDLYDAVYTVTASKDGHAVATQQVTLAYGEVLAGVDFVLQPVVEIQAAAAPHVAIPDNNATGVTSVIQVADSGTLADISVDMGITHPWIGDLVVRLTSPAGTVVTLHNRTGAGADDLIGNWPQTLAVDGPGVLADFRDEDVHGPWTLFVRDAFGGNSGTLETWGLHFLVLADITPVGDPLPRITRLLGGRPNPFNPQTTVAFDLARPGPARLEIFDLRGRLVRRLVDEPLPAGRHEARWNGRDGDDRDVASGVYLLRLQADGVQELQKATLVR